MGGGGKPRETIFPKHKNSAINKCCEKESSEKSAKNVFLYSHEYRDQKMGRGKKARKNFPETQE